MKQTVRLGACWVDLDYSAGWLVTHFFDGTMVPAAANHDPESVALAIDLGYRGDTWAMSVDHEIGHTWLAVHLDGKPWSPVLWRIAHGSPEPRRGGITDEEIAGEEARVLQFQRRLMSRPWADTFPNPKDQK